MLFWIFIIILILGLISMCLYVCSLVDFFNSDGFEYFTACLFAVGLLGVVISLVVIGSNYISVNSYIESSQQRYEILTYQVENNMYENDNEYGKKELMEKVQKWNEDLAKNKIYQYDFWIGIYVPNIYDQFEFIDYSSVN